MSRPLPPVLDYVSPHAVREQSVRAVPETDWTRHWEATLRRTRWVEKGHLFYPKGVAAERMTNRPDLPRVVATPRLVSIAAGPCFAPALWRPRKA